uniref:Piwi protein AF_1318 n=1 Tax=Anthurium amnicola TaxID=1678845 RepID=A0A1D1XR62_9ARAE
MYKNRLWPIMPKAITLLCMHWVSESYKHCQSEYMRLILRISWMDDACSDHPFQPPYPDLYVDALGDEALFGGLFPLYFWLWGTWAATFIYTLSLELCSRSVSFWAFELVSSIACVGLLEAGGF